MKFLRGGSKHISNSVFSVLDYASLPALMLITAPILVHHLGTSRYAIWILTSAATTSGFLLSSGFGDAAIKEICALHRRGDEIGVVETTRTLLGINLVLGTLIAGIIALSFPLIAPHVKGLTAGYLREYRISLMLGCVVLVVRSIESVFVSLQRAYECYKIPAIFSISTRVVTIGGAAVIAFFGGNTIHILALTLLVSLISVMAQGDAARRKLPSGSLWPSLMKKRIVQLRQIGLFTWLQGLLGLLTSQVDRMLVGYLLGTQMLTYYTVSTQAALPIHGIAAASLQILFPYFANRFGVLDGETVRRRVFMAFLVNLAIVAALSIPLLLTGHIILLHWLGAEFAQHATTALSLATIGFAFMGLNVTGYFVMLASGRVGFLALLNAFAAFAMLATMAALAPKYGLPGAMAGRVVFGVIICLVYVPLLPTLQSRLSGTLPPNALEGSL